MYSFTASCLSHATSSKIKIEFGRASLSGTTALLLKNVKPISSIDVNKLDIDTLAVATISNRRTTFSKRIPYGLSSKLMRMLVLLQFEGRK